MAKKIIGLIEKIKIGSIETLALMDTGAFQTSVDTRFAKEIGLGKPYRTTTVKNPSIKKRVKRPVVSATLVIAGRNFSTEVNLQDRSHMKFPVIVGRNILCGNFIIDPEKNLELILRKKP